MVKLIRWILGYVCFTFTDGFADGFVNQCYEEKINVQGLKINNGVLNGECLAWDYIRLHSVARKNGGRIRVEKKHGFIFPLLKLRNRWGLFAGALVFICVISFFSGFIWNIEIKGNERLKDEEILLFLEQNGLSRGTLWKNVDKNELEMLMLASFDECAWVQINELHTTASIEINETVEKPQTKNAKTPANIKAKKDGFIVKASVTNGWAAARAGDSVTQGDLLISGIYESDKKKGTQFAHASGEYIAEVKEPFSLTVARKQSYREYKKERIFRKISFFGAKIPLYITPYDKKSSELETSCNYLKLNKNELPIGIITVSEKRYAAKSRSLSDSQLKELMQKEIEKRLAEEFAGCEIIKRNISISINANDAVAQGEVIALEDIGEEVIIKISNK